MDTADIAAAEQNIVVEKVAKSLCGSSGVKSDAGSTTPANSERLSLTISLRRRYAPDENKQLQALCLLLFGSGRHVEDD